MMSAIEWCGSTGLLCRQPPTQLRVGTCGIVFTPGEDRVLVHQRADNGYWGFPGGAQELGETVLQALIREVYEETGLIIYHQWHLVGIYSSPQNYGCNEYPDGTCVQYCCLTFRAVLSLYHDLTALSCSSESYAVRWALTGRVPEPFLPGHRQRLWDALAYQNTPVLR